jgi:hypothetical protein
VLDTAGSSIAGIVEIELSRYMAPPQHLSQTLLYANIVVRFAVLLVSAIAPPPLLDIPFSKCISVPDIILSEAYMCPPLPVAIF